MKKKELKYKRLSPTERTRIEALYNIGHTYREIASALDRSVSTIYVDIHHGLYPHMGAETTKRPFHYSAQIAQDYADNQATAKGVPIKLGHRYDYAHHVSYQIKNGRSPDSITGRLRREGKWTVCTATLYNYIDRGYIPGVTNSDLLEKSVHKTTHGKVKTIVPARPPKGQSIEQRPAEIGSRNTPGHWEMDTVIGKAKGKKQALLVLTERYTRKEIIVHIQDKGMKSVVHALDRLFKVYPPGTFLTITVDNGCEFQDCNGMEHDKSGNKRTAVYYCHPYTSCERASNECANKIVRRFFPKGQSIEKRTSKDCKRAMDFMNNLPRRILNYATPNELFQTLINSLLENNLEKCSVSY